MPFRFTLVLVGCLFACSAQARLGALPPEAPRHVAARDLTAIERAGELRVLVNQSRHSSGEWNGQALGIEYRRLQAFARYLQHQPGGRPLRLVFVPKAKDDLLAALQRGEGDLVAPGETLLPPPHSALIAASVAAPTSLVWWVGAVSACPAIWSNWPDAGWCCPRAARLVRPWSGSTPSWRSAGCGRCRSSGPIRPWRWKTSWS